MTRPDNPAACHFCGSSGINPHTDDDLPCPECAVAETPDALLLARKGDGE